MEKNEKVKLLFLGTGTSQGVPLIACPCEVCQSEDSHDKRLRSSVVFQAGGKNIVIDTGPDFRQQMLRSGIKSISAVLFTHEHKDHVAGLDDVRAYNYILKKPIDVYVHQRVLEALKREFSYIFDGSNYPGIPKINVHDLKNESFLLDGIKVTPILAYHYKLPVFGFRIGDITYLTDANRIEDEEKEKIKGSKILVLNALRRESHISHFTLEEAIAMSRELKPEKTYFTHISHQMGKHREVSEELPENIFLAYDGLEIEA